MASPQSQSPPLCTAVHRCSLVLTAADPKGLKFEKISDAVDDINVAKLKASDAYDQSEFDSEKDKAGFRQFVDTNESSRRFYM